jgi:hypothetical protein
MGADRFSALAWVPEICHSYSQLLRNNVEAAARPVLWRKFPNAGTAPKLVKRIQEIDDSEPQITMLSGIAVVCMLRSKRRASGPPQSGLPFKIECVVQLTGSLKS